MKALLSNSSVHKLLQAFDGNKKLYGCEVEERKLWEACQRRFEQESDDSQRELILLSGPSGTGKTRLAETLCHRMEENEGYFVRGKFDQNKRSEPYLAFVQALTEYAALVERRGLEEKEAIRKLVKEEIDTESLVLLQHLIPPLQSIFGRSNDDVNSVHDTDQIKTSEAQERIKQVFSKFVQTVSSPDRPLVLFIDDLQWSDSSSLSLLQAIMLQLGSLSGLCLIGAVRGNEVSSRDELSSVLRFLEKDGSIQIVMIPMKNMHLETIEGMLYDLLRLSEDDTQDLATFVFNRSKGNAFFTRQLLRSMVERGELYYESNRWYWNQIKDNWNDSPIDVVDYILIEMKNLSETEQGILKIGSCLGTDFRKELIQHTCKDDESKIDAAFQKLIEEKGFLELDLKSERLTFAHDRIQQAANGLISDEEIFKFHLEIGRNLLAGLSDSQLDSNIFLVASQFTKSPELVSDQNERNQVTNLCLRAGEKAVLASAFKLAAQYFEYGINFLPKDCWVSMYNETLTLFNRASEAQYCVANFERMDELISNVLDNARIFTDMLPASTLRVYSLGSRRRYDEAIEEALTILRLLGEPFPSSDRRALFEIDLYRTKRMIGRKTDKQLVSLPIITNKQKIAALQILNILTVDAVFKRPYLAQLAASRMVRITLKYGQCATSSIGWMFYGNVRLSRGEHDAGYRFAKIALDVLNSFRARELLPRIQYCMYTYHTPWQLPVRRSIKPLWEAYNCGILTGDIEGASLAGHLFNVLSIYAGRSLKNVETEAREITRLMKLYKQEGMLLLHLPKWQTLLNFREATADCLLLSGEAMVESTILKIVEETGNVAVKTTLYFWKLWLACYFGDFATAEKLADQSRILKVLAWGTFGSCIHTFFECLTVLALAHDKKDRSRLKKARHLMKDLLKFENQVSCNSKNKVRLIEAEFAVLKGNYTLAKQKYIESIICAKEEKLMHEEGLAAERAAIAMTKNSDSVEAKNFILQAKDAYSRWGANSKVEQLNKIYNLK